MSERPTEADIDRARRRSQAFIAFDRLAEFHGQAEWQRFKRSYPMAFLRAKLDVQGGPPGLWLSVDWRNHEREEVLCLFEWPVIGRLERRASQISYPSLVQDEDDRFLAATARWIARDIEITMGTEFRILVRGNREAWEWHEDHKHDPPQDGRVRYRAAGARPANSVAPAELASGRKNWQRVVTRMVSERRCRAGTWRLVFSRRTFEPRDDSARAQWSRDHRAC